MAFSPIGPNVEELRTAAIHEQIQGNYDAALDLYEKAADLASKTFGANAGYVGDLYFEMGNLAFQSSKFQRAEMYLTRAVQIKPTSPTARAKLAELLLLRGRPDEARDQLEQALSKHGDSLEARHALAMSYLALNAPTRATLAFSDLDTVTRGGHPRIPTPLIKPTPRAILPQTTSPAITPAPEPKLEPKTKVEPKPKVETKSKIEPKPKPAPKPKTPPKTKVEPKPKSDTKPKAAPKSKIEPKPAFKPIELKAQPAELGKPPKLVKMQPVVKTKPPSAHGGLVPPPPPVVPIFNGFVPPPPPMVGAGSPGYQLKTDAKVKHAQSKAKEQPKDEEPAAPAHASTDAEDEDFLIDWAADKGGKRKKH